MKLFLPLFFVLLQQVFFSTAFSQTASKSADGTVVEPLYHFRELITFLHGPLKDSLSLARKFVKPGKHKFGIVDSKNQLVIPIIYDKIEIRYGSYLGIRERHLEQIRYFDGELYDYWNYEPESEEYAVLLKQELANPESFLNLSTKFWSDPIFTAQKDTSWGAINKSHEVLIPFVYESISEVGYDIFLAKKGGKYGIIDAENKELVPFACDTIIIMWTSPSYQKPEAEFYGLLKADGKYGLINLLTKQVILPKYNALEECHAFLDHGCDCGFPDLWKDYRPHSRSHYNMMRSFNKLLVFKKGHKFGLLNMTTMQEVTPFLCDSIRFKTGENRVVYLDGKATFLTYYNSDLHPFFYDDVSTIPSGYFKVEKQNLVGVFDKDGKNILELKWDDVFHVVLLWPYDQHQFIVKKDGKCGVVNNDKDEIIPLRYDSITFDYNNPLPYYKAYRDPGRVEIFETKGGKIIELKCDDVVLVHQFRNNSNYQFILKKDGKFGVVDNEKQAIIPLIYDTITYTYQYPVSYYRAYLNHQFTQFNITESLP